MAELIQPKVLKGFRDFLPEQEIARALLVERLTETFRKRGFVPIDTPALEYSEILLRKSDGETEKQVFRFRDNGDRDVALRFDLTVPFARFVAEHKEELYFPFKRYHIAKVWRGEKPQAGRYREFVQCDFDIVGSDSASVDFEILDLMKSALSAIGVDDVTIRLSHRGTFNRFLAKLGLSDKSEDILRTVDKLSKIGKEETLSQLASFSSPDMAKDILAYVSGAGDTPADFNATLELIERLAGGPADDTKRLREIHAFMLATGIAESFVLDPSITRGLDYYTGVVYETFLNKLPSIGSVCSGGRYDNLAGLYMKDRVPGVGSSIGLDRLMAGLDELGVQHTRSSFTDAVVFCQDEAHMVANQKVASLLRSRGVACEAFPDAKKMNQQYAWAEKKSILWGITVGATPGSESVCALKNLVTRESMEGLSSEQVAEKILKSRA
jgi:histidyl-tRNA synthetase